MDMNQAAVFLSGSILTVLAVVILVAGIVVINNILHRYWKSVRMFTADSWTLFGNNNQQSLHIVTQEEYEQIVKHIRDKEKDKNDQNAGTGS